MCHWKVSPKTELCDMNKRKFDFEPVHIRVKKIAGGKQSLFLDIVKDGVRKREFSGTWESMPRRV